MLNRRKISNVISLNVFRRLSATGQRFVFRLEEGDVARILDKCADEIAAYERAHELYEKEETKREEETKSFYDWVKGSSSIPSWKKIMLFPIGVLSLVITVPTFILMFVIGILIILPILLCLDHFGITKKPTNSPVTRDGDVTEEQGE